MVALRSSKDHHQATPFLQVTGRAIFFAFEEISLVEASMSLVVLRCVLLARLQDDLSKKIPQHPDSFYVS